LISHEEAHPAAWQFSELAAVERLLFQALAALERERTP